MDESNYAAQSLVHLFDRAKKLKERAFKYFMVTDGRRLFVTQLPIYRLKGERPGGGGGVDF